MKRLNEIKQNKDLDKLHEKAMRTLFDEVEGMILHQKRRDYKPVLVVSMQLKDKMLEVELLIDEKQHKQRFNNWDHFRKDFITNEEYEEKKWVIDALKKGRESLRKSANAPRARRPKSNIRYK